MAQATAPILDSTKASFPARALNWSLLVHSGQIAEFIGDPGWIRTSDPQLRRLVLYPAELRGLAQTSGLPALAAY